uniref:Uncharacterized protein n=1 Tax=Anguilla anguilla TaxID=7936 RepID=A0A0E9S8H0_ANGAN
MSVHRVAASICHTCKTVAATKCISVKWRISVNASEAQVKHGQCMHSRTRRPSNEPPLQKNQQVRRTRAP